MPSFFSVKMVTPFTSLLAHIEHGRCAPVRNRPLGHSNLSPLFWSIKKVFYTVFYGDENDSTYFI